jgi:hypothetical protein
MDSPFICQCTTYIGLSTVIRRSKKQRESTLARMSRRNTLTSARRQQTATNSESLLERDRAFDADVRGYLEITLRAIEDVANTVARMREFYRPRETQVTLVPVAIPESA